MVDLDMHDEQEEDLSFYASRKLVVDFNPEDQAAISEIKRHAQQVYLDIFSTTLQMIDDLFEKTSSGDNFGLLTSKELESYMLKLSQEKIQTTLNVNNTKLECLFSKYSLDDDYHAAYLDGHGTINLREAHAHTKTKTKRYGYFFHYFVYTMCDGLAKEIDGLIKNLNSTLYRRGTNG